MRGKAPGTTHAFRLVSIRKQDQNMSKIKINKCNGNVTVAVTVASQPAAAAGSKPSGPAGGLCFPATGAHVVTLGDLLPLAEQSSIVLEACLPFSASVAFGKRLLAALKVTSRMACAEDGGIMILHINTYVPDIMWQTLRTPARF